MWTSLKSVLPSLVAVILFYMPAHSAEPLAVVTEDWRPYSYAEDGVFKGSSTKIVRAVLDRAGITYSIQVLPWARAFRDASVKPNVLIYVLGRNLERDASFYWIGEVIPTDHAYFYRLKSRTDIVINNFSDAKKYWVSTNNKSSSHKTLIDSGFEKLVIVRHQELAIKMLIHDRIDLLILSESAVEPHFRELGLSPDLIEPAFRFAKGEGYMAFSKKTDIETVEQVRRAYRELVEEQRIPNF
jgi:polar amino acid transport system substrate-binding protein